MSGQSEPDVAEPIRKEAACHRHGEEEQGHTEETYPLILHQPGSPRRTEG